MVIWNFIDCFFSSPFRAFSLSGAVSQAPRSSPASQEKTENHQTSAQNCVKNNYPPASQEGTLASQEAIPANRKNSGSGTQDAHCVSWPFSPFGSLILALKDEKARMHIVHPSFFIFHLTPHTSHHTPRTSPLTPHTSHLTPPASPHDSSQPGRDINQPGRDSS